MLPSGGHVKIGEYEFLLDEQVPDHYAHDFEPAYVQKVEIAGAPGKASYKPERLMWSLDDWGAGEGGRIFTDEDPFLYEKSDGANGRIRGRITGRPDRSLVDGVLTTARVEDKPFLTTADGKLWYAGSYRIGFTDSGDSWTVVNSTGTAGTDFTQLQSKSTNYKITAVAGDHEWLYYTAWHSASSGTRILLRKQAENTVIAETVQSEVGSSAPFAGMALMNGRLYGWTGRRLWEFDVFQSLPLAAKHRRKVFDTGADPGSGAGLGSTWFADVVASENALFYFYSTRGRSNVYMFKQGVPRPIWQAPFGFTIKSMRYQNGILFMSGFWAASTDGWGALYALPLDNFRPVFVSFLRRHDQLHLQMDDIASSYGNTIMLSASNTGHIFIYDADLDAVSVMDDLGSSTQLTDTLVFTDGNQKIGDLITHGPRRAAIIYDPSDSGAGEYQFVYYEDDELDGRQGGTSVGNVANVTYSPKHDFGIPFEQKALHGFHVAYEVEDTSTTSGLRLGQEIKVEYSLDGGAWTEAATLTSSTTPSGGVKGRHFITVASSSNSSKFFLMQIRFTLTGKFVSSNSYPTPILLSLATEASLASLIEKWQLVVRVKDEGGNSKVSDRDWAGETARDFLEDLAENKSVISFLDGYRYRAPGSFTTHDVVVERVRDMITRNAEGDCMVELRAVAPVA